MARQFLLDSNTVIYYINSSLPEKSLEELDNIVTNNCNISVITQIEILGWQPLNPLDSAIYEAFVNNSNIIKLSDTIVTMTINLRKQYKMKLPDAIIAATAIVENLTLISRNDNDFIKIKELRYKNLFN